MGRRYQPRAAKTGDLLCVRGRLRAAVHQRARSSPQHYDPDQPAVAWHTPSPEASYMDEKSLLELWNVKRTQIITAQMGPTLVLITVLVLSAVGAFTSAPDSVKYLAIAVAAATGILAMITQYATIREAQSLVVDLDKLTQKSALSMKIAASKSFLSLTALAFVVIGIGIFVLVVWTVLG
jgi:hypothetical protein